MRKTLPVSVALVLGAAWLWAPTPHPRSAAGDPTRSMRVGSWTNIASVPGEAAGQIVRGLKYETFVITTNAYYDQAAGRWKSVGAGQVTAFVMESGSAWLAYVTRNPGGANVTINPSGGADPAWAIGTKFYSTPTGNVGIGRKFDATSGPPGTVLDGEPEWKLHLQADGSTRQVIQTDSDTDSSSLWFRRSRGTGARPVNVARGDRIGDIAAFAWTGGAADTDEWRGGAAIRFQVDDAVTPGRSPPVAIDFETGVSGGPTAGRLRIRSDGSMWTNNNAEPIAKTTGRLTGAMEPTSITVGPNGDTVSRILKGAARWDPASIAVGSSASLDVTVKGAGVGDPCITGFPMRVSGSGQAGMQISASVYRDGVAKVTISNSTWDAVDLDASTVTVTVIQHGG